MFATKSRSFRGDQLVSVKSATAIDGSPAKFDTNFNPKMRITDPGVYAIFFDNELVYVGKYQGRKADPFSGNVVSQRWAKHLATITCRGRGVSMASRTLQAARTELKRHDGADSLAEALRRCEISVAVTDRGCITSLPRIKFAARHWDSFESQLEESLKRFQFVYLYVPQRTDLSTTTVRAAISRTEDQIIKFLQPSLNVVGKVEDSKALCVSLSSYDDIIRRLAGKAALNNLFTDEDVLGLRAKFFGNSYVPESIESAFDSLCDVLSGDSVADCYFTETPDFRVAVSSGKSKRVIATLKYIPSKKQIRLRTLFPLARFNTGPKRINDPLAFEYRITEGVNFRSICDALKELLAEPRVYG